MKRKRVAKAVKFPVSLEEDTYICLKLCTSW